MTWPTLKRLTDNDVIEPMRMAMMFSSHFPVKNKGVPFVLYGLSKSGQVSPSKK
jgi:hypothetical protein